MKQAKKLKVFGLMTMLISMVFMVSSCSDDDTDGGGVSYEIGRASCRERV